MEVSCSGRMKRTTALIRAIQSARYSEESCFESWVRQGLTGLAGALLGCHLVRVLRDFSQYGHF